MPDLVDLEKMDGATAKRIHSALARWRWSQKSKKERKRATVKATAAELERRAKLKAAGIKVPRASPNMTKGELRARARKAVQTRKKRYPERHQPKKCRFCTNIAICHGLCRKHDQQWRRSTVPLADWLKQMLPKFRVPTTNRPHDS